MRDRLQWMIDNGRQRWFQARVRNAGVTIGAGCRIDPGSSMDRSVTIGDGTRINGPAVLKGNEPISIGNFCAIGEDVRMISTNHRMDQANLQVKLQKRLGFGTLEEEGRPIEVGHNVWIGDCAILLPGVRVGNGAVIGAGSVVTKDVAAFSVVAGVPARLIRMRLPEKVRDELERLQWWNWSEDEMRASPELFEAAHPDDEA